LSKTGRSTQPKSGRDPAHKIRLATSRTRPSSSTGRLSRTPTVRGTRSTPAAASSLGRTRSRGAGATRALGRTLRPTGGVDGQHARDEPPERRGEQPVQAAAGAHRDVAGVAGPHDQHPAGAQLGRVPVPGGVQLDGAPARPPASHAATERAGGAPALRTLPRCRRGGSRPPWSTRCLPGPRQAVPGTPHTRQARSRRGSR
jgi:hypothetical protein